MIFLSVIDIKIKNQKWNNLLNYKFATEKYKEELFINNNLIVPK